MVKSVMSLFLFNKPFDSSSNLLPMKLKNDMALTNGLRSTLMGQSQMSKNGYGRRSVTLLNMQTEALGIFGQAS